MGYARKDVEATKKYQKKFVRYQEGAEKYSLGLTKFQALAKEAKTEVVNQEVVERKIGVLPRETLLTYREVWSKKVWRGSQMMS